MPCIKTGAHIFLAQRGEYAYGDAFEIETYDKQTHVGDGSDGSFGNVAYFRIVQFSYRPLFPTLHFTVHDYDNLWHDKPVSTLITKAGTYTNHGYDGIPTPEVPYDDKS